MKCSQSQTSFVQVHKIDAEAWKKTEVVYIDIGDRSQVDDKVSTLQCLYFVYSIQKKVTIFLLLLAFTPSCPFHIIQNNWWEDSIQSVDFLNCQIQTDVLLFILAVVNKASTTDL